MRIVLIIGAACIALGAITVPLVTSNIKVSNNEIKVFNEVIKYERNEKEITFTHEDESEKITKESDVITLNKVLKFAEEQDMNKIMIASELTICLIAAVLIITKMVVDNIIKLFTNIHDGDTPFTLDNVNYIKRIANLLIITLIVEIFGNAIVTLLFGDILNISIGLNNILYILIIYVLSYIFEYGYEIQLDSNGKIYGDINE